MSKVDESLNITEYNSAAYLSLTEFLGHYGLTDAAIEGLPGETKVLYQDWVDNANRTVESALYKYNDVIPLDKSSETFTFAKSMALHWAQYEKASEENNPAKDAKLSLWKMDKAHMIETLQSQPQQTTTRVVTSSNFQDSSIPPYSQTYGVGDLL